MAKKTNSCSRLNLGSIKLAPGGVPEKISNDTSEPKGKYRCSCCGKTYSTQPNNFSVSKSPIYANNNGYITICKSCLEKYYLQLVEAYKGDEEKAIQRCCQLFDWYYSEEAWNMTKKVVSEKPRVMTYTSKINMIQIKEKGTTYLDTILQRDPTIIQSKEDIKNIVLDENPSEDSVDLEECMKFFGEGYTPEEYKFLNDQYEDWVARYECSSKVQEELFKNISLQQLVIKRTQKKGSAREVADAVKTLQDLLGTANIKPSQNNDNALVEANTFGTLIRKWENEKPIPEPLKEWEDVDGVKKYIRVWFVGHLCKMFKIKNKYSAMYEEELAKYTVTPPSYEEEDGNFDAVFNKGRTEDYEQDGDEDVTD